MNPSPSFKIQASIYVEKTLADCLACVLYVQVRLNSQIDSNITDLMNDRAQGFSPDFESIKNHAAALVEAAVKIQERVTQYQSDWQREKVLTPTSPNWENSDIAHLTDKG
jgi:hypothetical protein